VRIAQALLTACGEIIAVGAALAFLLAAAATAT